MAPLFGGVPCHCVPPRAYYRCPEDLAALLVGLMEDSCQHS
ncbi:Uncharacterised protein [Nocardia otitidiscaviarum]|uniref:Uncharacterized protein n=1 Tax=Nocardia otitidiscaviarum TaxID=1823 RepID=A0A378YJU6_9NOCA|nr:Uncharacterised protein [Nocardia otitidiscaviarum]